MYDIYKEQSIIGKSRRYMRQHCQGVHTKKSCLNKEKKTLESGALNHDNKLRHPAHDDEQQQQQPPHTFHVRVISTTAGAAVAEVI